MQHRVIALVLFLGVLFMTVAGHLAVIGCSPSTAAVLVKTANDGSPLLLEAYRQDGLEALAQVPCSTGEEDCDKATKVALDAVDARWAPVWAAWDAFSVARDVYEEARISGGMPNAQTLERAYCALMSLLPMQYRAVLHVPMVRCEA